MQFIERTNLEEEYLAITGTTCKVCGSPIVTNENFTVVKCVNSYCKRKVAGQIQKIIQKTPVKGYGIESIMKLIYSNSYTCVTDFLKAPPADLKEPIALLIAECKTLTQAIQLLAIPTFDSLASRMFDYYQTYEMFLDAVDKEFYGDMEAMCRKYYGNGVQSSNVNETLFSYSDDLYEVDSIFNFEFIDESHINYEITICISGEVNSDILRKYYEGRITKTIAVQLLNDMFNDRGFKFVFSKNFTNNVDYLLRDDPTPSNKSSSAESRGVLKTTDEFIQDILSTIKEGEQK